MPARRRGEIYERRDGEYGWRVKSANNNTTSASGEGFGTRAGAEKALRREHPGLPIVDKTTTQKRRGR